MRGEIFWMVDSKDKKETNTKIVKISTENYLLSYERFKFMLDITNMDKLK